VSVPAAPADGQAKDRHNGDGGQVPRSAWLSTRRCSPLKMPLKLRLLTSASSATAAALSRSQTMTAREADDQIGFRATRDDRYGRRCGGWGPSRSRSVLPKKPRPGNDGITR
jgi:hypothetical protein